MPLPIEKHLLKTEEGKLLELTGKEE